jgi:hypothetical protein
MSAARCAIAAVTIVLSGAAFGMAPSSAAVAALPPTPAFSPVILAQAGALHRVYVIGSAPCDGGQRCLQLWESATVVAHVPTTFTERTLPLRITASPYLITTQGLVFANARDGLFTTRSSSNAPTQVYATTDAGERWRPVDFGMSAVTTQLIASGNVFDALLEHCTRISTGNCTGYTLARSVAGSTRWSFSAFPPHGALRPPGASAAMGAAGSQLWITYVDPKTPVPQLAESTGGHPPRFTVFGQPRLAGVVACALAPMAGGVIWANCPTGMMVSELRSTDGGHGFTAVWSYAGTGGFAFDPVSADIAFRYLGIESPAVERTTDGGQTFTGVGTLPFAQGSVTRLLFLDEADGFALGSTSADTAALLQTIDGGSSWSPVSF